ncbi:MAG TPA: hypothetical protein V6D14_31735 [Coleofasciculaceae cyanobacterium]|jgi:hypothetical protein
MSGQAGARGYFIQTLICVLNALEDEKWHSLIVEPNPNLYSDKVDVIWDYPNHRKVVQIKHSQNQIRLANVTTWAEELERSVEVEEYELILIGSFSQGVIRKRLHGKVSITRHSLDFTNPDFRTFTKRAAQDLDNYLESKNIKSISPKERELLVDAIISKFTLYSTSGSKVVREDFDKLLFELVQASYTRNVNEPFNQATSSTEVQNIFHRRIAASIREHRENKSVTPTYSKIGQIVSLKDITLKVIKSELIGEILLLKPLHKLYVNLGKSTILDSLLKMPIFTNELKAGGIWKLLSIEITNTSKSPIPILAYYNRFILEASTGESYTPSNEGTVHYSMFVDPCRNNNTYFEQLQPSRTKCFNLVYDVNLEAKEFKLIVKPVLSLTRDEKTIIIDLN